MTIKPAATGWMGWHRLFRPVPLAPLVLVRVALGIVTIWEVWRYFQFDRIARYYSEPAFLFPYYGFDFVQPLDAAGMIALFHLIGVLGLGVLLGLLYRLGMTLLFLCFSYVFLLDQAQYLNHFYLMSLIYGLMIFVPAHRAASLDAWLRPGLRASTAPAWALGLLRGQMALVYVYGGIAKLNGDWLHGEPLRLWLGEHAFFAQLNALLPPDVLPLMMSYGGLLLDLLVVPALLWRRTRLLALALSIVFHLTNAYLFNIGVFPWLALALTVLFLPPAWFQRWSLRALPARTYRPTRVIGVALMVYFAIQITLPLRHWLYPGDPSWTEEGHNLAWHMRLRDKRGAIRFFAHDVATGTTWEVDPLMYLSERQQRQMAQRPDMILQFAHFLAAEQQPVTGARPQIFVWTQIALNSRAPQMLIDPTVDLSAQPRDLLPNAWVLPLMQPLTSPALPLLWLTQQPPALINMGSAPVPLARLTLTHEGQPLLLPGAPPVLLPGAPPVLLPGECLLAAGHYAACNQVGTLPPLPAPLTLLLDGQPVGACAALPCALRAARPLKLRAR